MILEEPLLPCLMLRLVGFAVREKSGAVTLTVMVAVCVSVFPLIPVTVTVYVPAAVPTGGVIAS